MGLVTFQGRRVGFWLAERSQDPQGEIPAGLVAREEGTKTALTRALVLVGVGEDDLPLWASIVHAEEGAALVCPFGDTLAAGLGGTLVLLDRDGIARGKFEAPSEELTGAWPVDDRLLLATRGAIYLVDGSGKAIWRSSIPLESLMFLGAKADVLTFASMGRDDWREVRLDAHTGRPASREEGSDVHR